VFGSKEITDTLVLTGGSTLEVPRNVGGTASYAENFAATYQIMVGDDAEEFFDQLLYFNESPKKAEVLALPV